MLGLQRRDRDRAAVDALTDFFETEGLIAPQSGQMVDS